MDSCERERELYDLVLDELDPEKAKELQAHIERCAACAGSWQRLREVRQALLSSLTDQEMPARIVFAPERRKGDFARFWPSLARVSAFSAVAACIFLAVVSLGLARWRGRWATGQQSALTAAQVQALVSRAVAEQAALQAKESAATNEALASNLRQEEVRDLAQLARRQEYLELAQNTFWKQTQQQSALVALIARDYVRPNSTASSAKPQR